MLRETVAGQRVREMELERRVGEAEDAARAATGELRAAEARAVRLEQDLREVNRANTLDVGARATHAAALESADVKIAQATDSKMAQSSPEGGERATTLPAGGQVTSPSTSPPRAGVAQATTPPESVAHNLIPPGGGERAGVVAAHAAEMKRRGGEVADAQAQRADALQQRDAEQERLREMEVKMAQATTPPESGAHNLIPPGGGERAGVNAEHAAEMKRRGGEVADAQAQRADALQQRDAAQERLREMEVKMAQATTPPDGGTHNLIGERARMDADHEAAVRRMGGEVADALQQVRAAGITFSTFIAEST